MTIKEVSRLTGITVDNLRYYERIGLFPPVPRTSSGIRNYDQFTLELIEFIMKFKQAGMPLESIIEYVHLTMEDDNSDAARREILTETKSMLEGKIASLQGFLDLLNYKLEHYDSLCQPVSDALIAEWKARFQ